MKKRIAYHSVILMFALALCLSLPLAARASPVAGFTNEWATVPDLDTWLTNHPAEANASISNASQYLQVTFPASEPPQALPVMVGSLDAAYTGVYTQSGLTLKFRFMADDTLPSGSTVFMIGGVTLTQWEWSFANTALDDWEVWSVGFNWADWGGGTAEDFASDLTDIHEIGVRIVSDEFYAGQQSYGIDGWGYEINDNETAVPEPGTMCMLAAVFMPLGLTLRRRLRDAFHADKQQS